MANDYYWKIWLRPNLLATDTEEELFAEVLTEKETLRNEDIADMIIREGSEIKRDTLVSIINLRDRIIRENLMKGYSIQTGVCQYTPRVTGTWNKDNLAYDANLHKIILDITPSEPMREALVNINIQVLGVKNNASHISLVTDTATGKTDGSLTPGDDIRIDGDRLKIVGDESVVGIFFVSEDRSQTIQVTRRFTLNESSCIIARVPPLAKGKYRLRLVTQYMQGYVLLKSPHTIEYARWLTVE